MSDKTPDPTGASDRQDDALEGESVDRSGTGDGGATPESVTGTGAPGGRRRRSTSAPVRRSSTLDPDADDETIAQLEDGFTDDEQADAAAVRRSSGRAPVKKATATRKRSASEEPERDPYTASNPAEFVKQSASEIQKVVWPTWPQLSVLFLSVLIFVLFVIAFVGLLDIVFGWGLLALFGDS